MKKQILSFMLVLSAPLFSSAASLHLLCESPGTGRYTHIEVIPRIDGHSTVALVDLSDFSRKYNMQSVFSAWQMNPSKAAANGDLVFINNRSKMTIAKNLQSLKIIDRPESLAEGYQGMGTMNGVNCKQIPLDSLE